MTQSIPAFAVAIFAAVLTTCSGAEHAPMLEPESIPVGEAWRPFSDDSPWNTPLGDAPVFDADSAAYIEELASFGAWFINMDEWSVPVYEIDMSETPKHAVLDLYPNQIGRGFEQPRAIPIPDGATPGLPNTGTRYMAIIDRERGLEWDMKQATLREDGRWFIGFGAVTNLRGTGTYRPWNEQSDPNDARTVLPSGFPLLAGLIRVDEIKAGRIDHALAFSYPGVRPGYFVPPAATAGALAGDVRSDDKGLPLGTRIQLDPDWDVENSALTREGKIIARALQEYGAYLSDQAGANVFLAESSPAALKEWEGLMKPEVLQSVFTPEMISKHFRVIELGEQLPGELQQAPVADQLGKD